MKTLKRCLQKKWIMVPIYCIAPIFLFYLGFINHIEPTEVGIARNLISGEMWLQEESGIYITAPWVGVAVVDTRPMRIGVTSAGHGYSAKLVQFNKQAWKEFVEIEGWRYYWFANRFSFNCGYDEEYRGIKDIMRGYAYSPTCYPFLIVLKEYQTK